MDRPMQNYLMFVSVCLTVVLGARTTVGTEPVEIGSRLELFVDDYLIGDIEGDAGREMRLPKPQEVVLVADAPWEGNTSGYYTLFRDGERFRMIYRGWQHDEKMKAVHQEVTCYAESNDGIHWTKPNLGLFEWKGSKDNNIVWLSKGTHNFTAFRDDNPSTPDRARYKAFGGVRGGLLPFQSADCKTWNAIQEKPVITNGAFDSQNLVFWDSDKKEYRAYWRYFTKGVTTNAKWQPAGVRAIRTATSKDFIHWENEADLVYDEGTPAEHLYTNAVQKYFRAPHLFIGFPTRFLPKQGQRVEPVLMSSRDGIHFSRWADPVISEDAPEDRKGNRSNYMAWGMFTLPGKPKEISVYATENYFESTPGRLRRFTFRVDGFVALHGGDGGIVTTKPLRYEGNRLLLNHVVPPGGSLSVEVLDASGDVIGKSKPIVGDEIDAAVVWEQDPGLGAGVVQLRFMLTNADVYSLKFD